VTNEIVASAGRRLVVVRRFEVEALAPRHLREHLECPLQRIVEHVGEGSFAPRFRLQFLRVEIVQAPLREAASGTAAVAVVVDAGNQSWITRASDEAVEFGCIHASSRSNLRTIRFSGTFATHAPKHCR